MIRHPEHDIFCCVVTKAGGRRVTADARKRGVPIHCETLDLGLMDLVAAARTKGWKTLWAAVDERGADSEEVSQSLSPFWSAFGRDTIAAPKKVLSGFRHTFNDRPTKRGASQSEQNESMGRADEGMSKRSPTKVEPKPVDIVRLDQLVQNIDRAFLKIIGRAPSA